MTTKTKRSVAELVDDISNLTVLELSELVKALQEKFGVTASAPVQVVAQAVPGAEPAKAAAEEKSEFTITLTASGDKKIQVLKVLRELTGLGLKEAKDLVDNPPKVIKEGATKEEAQNFKTKLEEVGATVEVK
jgi:large subunit ribosomal protein L7/L12|uniref:Large ribosomal subunit protein bL12 n=1 Tax=candidate division WOR-3 bacterium TaxID=2052148 RepID=A0A7C6AF54_UNCW3